MLFTKKLGARIRRGIFFSIDALLASILLISGLLATYWIYTSSSKSQNLWYYSSSTISALSSITPIQINDSYCLQLAESGILKNASLNSSILEVIGELWALNHTAEASEVARRFVEFAFEDTNLGVAVYVNGQLIYSRNSSLHSDKNADYLSSSFRLVSGIQEEKPKEGYSARAILNSISSKVQPVYVYFGGLVGQGNITQFLVLPSNYTRIIEAYFEMEVGSNFTLKINGNYSGDYPSGCSGGGNLIPYKCYINQTFLQFLKPGLNTIEFIFQNYSTAYITGGFFRVSLLTSELNYSETQYDPFSNTASKIEYLPGVSKIINIYSSAYVPGEIKGIEIFLNYTTSLPLFVNLAGQPVYYSDAEGNIVANISNESIAAALNYSFLSEKTIPVKIGHYALNNTGNITGGNADVLIITDISASMKGSIGYNDSNGDARTCDQADYFTNPHVRRINVAVCLNEIFIKTIMNVTGNRVWLLTFNDKALYYYSNNSAVLLSYVNNKDYYPWNQPSGNTCTCCALNLAYSIINAYSNSSRKKYVILMTDGIPNECCGLNASGGCNTTGTSNLSQYLPAACSEDYVTECAGNDCSGPIQNAIYAASRIGGINRTTIHAIGLGPMGSCQNANYTMSQIAEKGNGTFYASTNVTQLTEFVQNLANEIVNKSLIYQYQLVVIQGVNSTLYPNSFIKIYYTPTIKPLVFGKIPITIESERFGNYITSGSIFIPPGVQVVDAQLTSYSGYYWSKEAYANSINIFNLSQFGSYYAALGDPFLIGVPPRVLQEGNNTFLIKTGYSANSSSGGSPEDRAIYTLLINNSVTYSAVEPNAEGCNWLVQFADGTNSTIKIPPDYSGINNCTFLTASYNPADAIQEAAYNLFLQLDLNRDGILDVNINQQSLIVDTVLLSKVPSMWGPAKVEVRVWR
ncbi:MAG: vWA domain-containing protein [Candidatus Woesearchaeota archaeon]